MKRSELIWQLLTVTVSLVSVIAVLRPRYWGLLIALYLLVLALVVWHQLDLTSVLRSIAKRRRADRLARQLFPEFQHRAQDFFNSIEPGREDIAKFLKRLSQERRVQLGEIDPNIDRLRYLASSHQEMLKHFNGTERFLRAIVKQFEAILEMYHYEYVIKPIEQLNEQAEISGVTTSRGWKKNYTERKEQYAGFMRRWVAFACDANQDLPDLCRLTYYKVLEDLQ